MIATRSSLVRAIAVLLAVWAATVACEGFAVGSAAAAVLGRTLRVAPPGIDPNGPSGEPSIGGNGRYVAFASFATNLGPAVGGAQLSHIYLLDFFTGRATLLSPGLDGAPANGSSTNPSVSADGSVVAFASKATNLVTGTPSRHDDVYVKVGTGPVRLLSVGFGGAQSDADSSEPAVSANGQFVAFTSEADNLIPADDNAASDIFVADLATGKITRVSVSTHGAEANGPSYNPSISADGHLVSFTSDASNLVRGDHNHAADVFVHNVNTGVTQRVSVSSQGHEQNAAVPAPFTEFSDLSGDGHYVVFDSNATNLVPGVATGHTNVFRHSLASGHTWLVSKNSLERVGDNDSFAPATSGDGAVTVFESFADNLATPWVPNENVFAQDFTSSTALTVDVAPDGGPRAAELDPQLLQQPAVSADGQVVAFTSGADNLIAGDYNGADNLYVRVIIPPTTTAVEQPPSVTTNRRPLIELRGSNALATIGLCTLDGRRMACPIGRPFRLPELHRGPHVLRAYAADPGTLFDPQGVRIAFTVAVG